MKHPRKNPQVFGITAIISALLAANAFAAGVKDPAEAGSAARKNITENQAASETLKGKARMVEIAQKLGISQTELEVFFKNEMNGASKRVWSELLVMVSMKPKANASKEDFQHINIAAETLSSYITLRQQKVLDNLSIREADLVAVQKNWTLNQKTNFAKTLRKASELAKTGKFNTLEDAFQQALVDLGFKAEYDRCKAS